MDANSGMKWAVTAGAGYDEAGAKVLERLRAESTVIELSDEERAKWMEVAQKASDAYVTSLNEQGLPGTETYEAVKGYVSECEAELN